MEQTSDTTRSLDGALYASLAHLQANNVSAAADLVRQAVTATPATYVLTLTPLVSVRATVCGVCVLHALTWCVFVLGSTEQFEKWANTLAEEATSANLAQPAAGLLRALTGVAPADAALEELAAQLDAEAASAAAAAAAPETTEQAADSEPAAAEADGAEKKEEAQA